MAEKSDQTKREHEDSLSRLIEEFPDIEEGEVRKVYEEKRINLESGARIMMHIPNMAYTRARNVLKQYGQREASTSA